MKAQMSRRSFTFPSDYLGEMADCDADLGDVAALRRRMERDGYLLLRGFSDREAVLAIRRLIVERIAAEGWLEAGRDAMDARIDPRRSGAPSVDARLPAIARFFDEQPFPPFFERYFGAPAMRYPRVLTRIQGHRRPHRHPLRQRLHRTRLGAGAELLDAVGRHRGGAGSAGDLRRVPRPPRVRAPAAHLRAPRPGPRPDQGGGTTPPATSRSTCWR